MKKSTVGFTLSFILTALIVGETTTFALHPSCHTAKNPAPATPAAETVHSSTVEEALYSVHLSGGFDTDPQDKGRPVILIAAALDVPTEVFREAFSGVSPAGLNSGGPTEEEARHNKAALMDVLGPLGITNDRLDEVSNYYRYNGQREESWPQRQAAATAIVENGKVTGIALTDPGSGYTSPPTITIRTPNGTVFATAEMKYTTDFQTNGSLAAITLQ